MEDRIFILKSDVLDRITEEHEAGGFTDYSNYSNLWDSVDDMPAADAQPVKHGRWIWDSNAPHREHGAYKCSNCGCHSDFEENYCYNCGARMIKDGEIDE